MVLAMKILIMLYEVSSYLIRPLEIWLILYLLKDLVYRFPEHYVNYLAIVCLVYPAKSLLGRLPLYLSDLKSLRSGGITLTFPFPSANSLQSVYTHQFAPLTNIGFEQASKLRISSNCA